MTKELYELTLEELYKLTLEKLKALYADGNLTREDLFTALHWLGDRKDALSIFQWLKELTWITKNDLFRKDNFGSTVLHWLADNKDALSIFQWLKDLKWITKDDLFIENNDGETVLHWFEEENRNKVLALFDDKE